MRIERVWMRNYFRSTATQHEDGEVWFTDDAVARLVAGAMERRHTAAETGFDTREAIQARIDEARTGLTRA